MSRPNKKLENTQTTTNIQSVMKVARRQHAKLHAILHELCDYLENAKVGPFSQSFGLCDFKIWGITLKK